MGLTNGRLAFASFGAALSIPDRSKGPSGPLVQHVLIDGFETELRHYLKSENKPGCGINGVAIEVAVSKSIIDLRKHEPAVSLKLGRKPPLDGE